MSKKILTGTVFTASLCETIDNVEIILTNSDDVIVECLLSDLDGKWQVPMNEDISIITFSKKGFVSKKYPIDSIPNMIRLLEDSLIGYQDKLWFQPGENIDVYVHSSKNFKVELYRHGILKEHICTIGTFESYLQEVPDEHFVEFGLTWKKNFSYKLDQNLSPGIYSLLLMSNDAEKFAIPMIISTPSHKYGQHSNILVLASTNNWQSYNIWGGRSRYRNFENGSSNDFIFNKFTDQLKRTVYHFLFPVFVKKLIKNYRRKRQYPDWFFKRLSVRRPFTNCALEDEYVFKPFTNHLAAGEWRVLAWFEREKINYDIVSGAELDSNPSLLENYDMIIFSTHCEYWSKQMYDTVRKFHENQKGTIINLSGNTMYREVEFFEDGSTRCVSLFFQDSYADETQLIGVRFTDDDYSTCSPYKILKRNHWVFDNVPLNKEDELFGMASLNQNTIKKYDRYDPGRPGVEFGLLGAGASGWETDKLSSTAPADIVRVAKGINRGGGADMVVRMPHEKRGGMFSVSSLTFGGSLLIDDVSSTIIKNVIERFRAKG